MKHTPSAIVLVLLLWLTASASVTYTYDATGHLTKIDYGNGSVIVYAYDGAGNLISRQIQGVTTAITIQTTPPGLQFTVDTGAAQTAPQTLNLSQGPHTIAVTATQAGSTGTQYVFSSWSDSGAVSHSITVGSSPVTYTATFQTQYQLTTAASPSAGGTVTPASGAFQNAGSVVSVQAAANAGYQFANFSGALTGSGNPQNVTMNGPTNVVANFTPLAPNMAASVGTRTVAGSTVVVKLTLTNTGVGSASDA